MRALALLPVVTIVFAPLVAHAQQAAPLAPLPMPAASPGSPATVPPPPPPPAMPAPPPPQPIEPPTFDGSGAPASVTRVGMVPPPPPLMPPPPIDRPPPIDCTGPGTFTHDGFYMRSSLGLGWLGAEGKSLGRTVSAGGAAAGLSLLFGGTPSRGFVVGGVLSGVSASSPSSSGLPAGVTGVSSGMLGGFADWYPNEHGGWHVGGTLGVGATSVEFGSTTWTTGSLAGKLGGGYDFWIGPQWSLGLQGGVDFVTRANLEDSNRNDTGYSLGSLGITLGVSFVYH